MSHLYLDVKFAKIIGVFHDRFKIKKESPFHGQCRCKICGDSTKSKTLARFHFREYDQTIFVKCFNCGYTNSIGNYMKMHFPQEYSEYVFERYRKDINNTPIITTQEEVIQPQRCDGLDLPYVKDLPSDHPIALYVRSRKLPDYPFQYAHDFFGFSAQFKKDLDETVKPEGRLIIPFFDRKGRVFAYQGRDMSGTSKAKYLTITIDATTPKIFGIDRADFKKPIYIVEGPIDSLFLPNCVASVNASLVATARKLESIVSRENMTLIFDNEPRNKVIVDLYQKAIKDGYKIVIWPKEVANFKDINDLALGGYDPVNLIKKNTFTGLRAQMELSNWKKV